jgi:nitroreductase
MELDVCIKGRRSVRAYEQKPVPRGLIEQILEAGTWAPTGMNGQPWKFVIIEEKELIKYVSDETKKIVKGMNYPQAERITSTNADTICYNAPVLILVCAEKTQHPMYDQVQILDCVLATQNMFLKAYELGLGTCYMGFVSALAANPQVMKKVGVPDHCQMIVPFILGYPKTNPPAPQRKKPDVVNWLT